jgi:redox-sensitive bicupin YhaK (pirin superfamily)
MGWGKLRVWNDDTIQPGTGFPMHGHRDMEIITYVRRGAISHGDHLGNRGRTTAGDVQVMHAGSGIMHEEYNREDEASQIFQIWIEPNETGVDPGWATRAFPKGARAGKLVTLASGRAKYRAGEGDEGPLPLHQDAAIAAATLEAGQRVTYNVDPGRAVYLVLATGKAKVGDVEAEARDGLAIADEGEITIEAIEETEILLSDTPA